MHVSILSTNLFRFQLTNGHSEVIQEVTVSDGSTTGDQKAPIIMRRVSYSPAPGKSFVAFPTHGRSCARLNLSSDSIEDLFRSA